VFGVWSSRARCATNTSSDFATIIQSIDDFLDSLANENRDLLKSLVTHNFQTFDFPKS
jgi:hypothetical protein